MLKEKEIDTFLDELRPALNSDGGDVELIEFDQEKGVLKLHFVGACNNCAILDVTLTQYINEEVAKKFPQIKEVVAV